MARAAYIDVDILRQILKYEPETGKLFWLERPAELFADTGSGGATGAASRWNGRNAGKEALVQKARGGYLSGTIFWRPRFAHQVAWALHYGEWPMNPIDHINGDRADNRIANLRCVSYTDNARNQRIPKNNTSGVMGVRFYTPLGRWLATIGVGGRKIHLGYFDNKESAIAARKEAETRYGFHPNHGRRA